MKKEDKVIIQIPEDLVTINRIEYDMLNQQLTKYKILIHNLKKYIKENITEEYEINLTNKEKCIIDIVSMLEEIE